MVTVFAALTIVFDANRHMGCIIIDDAFVADAGSRHISAHMENRERRISKCSVQYKGGRRHDKNTEVCLCAFVWSAIRQRGEVLLADALKG